MKRRIYYVTTDHDKGQGLSELSMTRQPSDDELCDCGHRYADHDHWPDYPCSKCSCINPRYVMPLPAWDQP